MNQSKTVQVTLWGSEEREGYKGSWRTNRTKKWKQETYSAQDEDE